MVKVKEGEKMGKKWDRCEHCNGNTKCDCGECRVYIGEGYSSFTKGICIVCGGQGGQYINENTGLPYDSSDNYPDYDQGRKRR